MLSHSEIILHDTIEATGANRDGSQALVGRTGTALTALRPAGKAVVDGATLDVVTNGEFIAKDTQIEVLHVEGMRILVRAIDESAK